MSSLHHEILRQQEASRATPRGTPSPPRGRRFSVQGHWGGCLLVQHPIYTWGWYNERGIRWEEWGSPQNPPKCPSPSLAPLPTPSSQSTLCTCLSLTKHTPGGVCQLSMPLSPGPREHKPPWQP